MHSEITVRTFQQWLEELAPPELAASWDNVGLQVGHPENRVQKVMISLDPSLSVVNEAIQFQCNLIITHHPLIFKPLNRINLDEPVGRVLQLAILNGISVLSAHTNLDAANGGVNDALTSLLGLNNVKSVQEAGVSLDETVLASIVRVGYFDKSMNITELSSFLKERLRIEKVTVVSASETVQIRKVLICGGSGGGAVKLAVELDCDALISGDIKYHDAMYAMETGLAVFDVGHFASEQVVVSKLVEFFEKKIEASDANIEILAARSEKDPFTVM